jgi:hypothetical protein
MTTSFSDVPYVALSLPEAHFYINSSLRRTAYSMIVKQCAGYAFLEKETCIHE